MKQGRDDNRVRTWLAVERAGRELEVLVEAAHYRGEAEWFDYRKGVGGPRIEPELEFQGATDEDGGEVSLTKEEERRAIDALWDALRDGA